MEEQKNIRPSDGGNLPVITLLVLVLIIVAMLYTGWEYLADKPGDAMTSPKNSIEASQVQEKEPVQEEPTTKVIDVAQEGVDAGDGPTQTEKKVTKLKPVAEKEEKKEDKPKVKEEKPLTEEPKKEEVKIPKGGVLQTHTVDMGETFYGLANRYNMKWATLKALNPDIKDVSKDFKVGVTKVKVRLKATHTVGVGDILQKVAEKYGISKELLMATNGKTKDFVERGEKLLIPYPEKE